MFRIVVAALFALLCGARATEATILIGADLGELSRGARTIARGRVVAVEGRWRGDHRGIETLVTLEVDAYLKGTLGPTLQFLVPGGQLGRYRSIFVGAPVFAVDERIVIFLGVQGPSIPYVLGLSQGIFRLVASEDGSGWLLTPPPLVPVADAPRQIVRGDPTRRLMPLAAFESQVRALVSEAPLLESAGPRTVAAARRALAR